MKKNDEAGIDYWPVDIEKLKYWSDTLIRIRDKGEVNNAVLLAIKILIDDLEEQIGSHDYLLSEIL
jgi:hypothetical protein